MTQIILSAFLRNGEKKEKECKAMGSREPTLAFSNHKWVMDLRCVVSEMTNAGDCFDHYLSGASQYKSVFLHYTDCVPPFKSIFKFHSPFVSSSKNPENLTSEAIEAMEAQLGSGLECRGSLPKPFRASPRTGRALQETSLPADCWGTRDFHC